MSEIQDKISLYKILENDISNEDMELLMGNKQDLKTKICSLLVTFLKIDIWPQICQENCLQFRTSITSLYHII